MKTPALLVPSLGVMALLVLLLCSCEEARSRNMELAPAPAPVAAKPSNVDLVPIEFCTNRTENPGATGDEDRFTASAGPAIYGCCTVSIPRDHHRIGHVERPSCFRGEFVEDPAKHVVIAGIATATADDFFKDVAGEVARDDRHAAFVFVHGFNVTFAEAARRTGQIAYDLGFSGAPMLFSWPAHGGFWGSAHYRDDVAANAAAVPVLRDFLRDVARRSAAERIYLIAHSMGTVVASQALCQLDAADAKRFTIVIFAAPDIDAGDFRRTIAPALVAKVPHLTLYASSADRVLRMSKDINGGARAGDSDGGVVVVPQMESIDATAVDTSFFGHSYYSNERTVLDDIYYLINTDLATPKRFGMWTVSGADGDYFLFRP